MMLGSKNTYFFNPEIILDRDFNNMVLMLQIKEFEQTEIEDFKRAFIYFRDNPNDFDGSTLTQDLEDIKGLELASMLHDFQYVFLKVMHTKKEMRKSDSQLFKNMKQFHKSGFEISKRIILLFIAREILNYSFFLRLKIKLYEKFNKKN